MRKVLVLCVLVGMVGCGPQKKVETDVQQETQQEYDYKRALQNYQIGVNYLNNNQVLEAVSALEQAVQQDRGNFRYQHALGLAYSMNGELAKAEHSLKQALAINPNDSESYNLLGSIYVDQERFEDAVAAFRKVIRDKNYSQPKFPYYNMGLALRRQGRLSEAVAAFQRAVAIDPDFYRVYISLAEIYQENNDYKHALHFYKKAEPGFNDSVDLLYQIGHAFFKLKQFNQAKAYLAQVSILFPPPQIDQSTQEMLRYIELKQRRAMN
ncbi:tetratricopeptide repeat protein [Acanthopleuribacter pedis]|uniref:Tetratricopeptide repeat protein n=1 Tax=Acanthopleuribacter pedis TaxID=442870 RepID=A0A8J7U232_9BACT|nr:tetratricopeptide repeat protein [Acanthopleuribacter pedis]MBO1318182.1 tetratricopeptide repeat protein [Acanthopleuribacter pedis]